MKIETFENFENKNCITTTNISQKNGQNSSIFNSQNINILTKVLPLIKNLTNTTKNNNDINSSNNNTTNNIDTNIRDDKIVDKNDNIASQSFPTENNQLSYNNLFKGVNNNTTNYYNFENYCKINKQKALNLQMEKHRNITSILQSKNRY